MHLVTVSRAVSPDGSFFAKCLAGVNHERDGAAPAVHFEQMSSMDVFQSVEIPMRFLIKGLPRLDDKYTVYLHALQLSDGNTYKYYGMTKKGWAVRFNQHMRDAICYESPLRFHSVLRNALLARQAEITHSVSSEHPAIRSSHHIVCATCLREDEACQIEAMLVEKHSFQKPFGLNMIPGGKAGIAFLHSWAR